MFLKPTSYDYEFFIKNPRLLNFCFGFILFVVLMVNEDFYFLFFILMFFIVDYIFIRKNNNSDFFFVKYKMYSHVFLLFMVYGVTLSFAWSLGFSYFLLNFFLVILFSLLVVINTKKNYKNNMEIISEKYHLAVREGEVDLYEWVSSLNVKKTNKFILIYSLFSQVALGFIIGGGLGSDHGLHEYLLLILCYFLTTMLIYIFPYNYFLPYIFLKNHYIFK